MVDLHLTASFSGSCYIPCCVTVMTYWDTCGGTKYYKNSSSFVEVFLYGPKRLLTFNIFKSKVMQMMQQ